MDWDTAFDGKQEWDKDIQSNDVPQNAVVLKRPENIFQGLAPYFFGPILLCFLTVFLKRFLAEESFLDFRFFSRILPVWILYWITDTRVISCPVLSDKGKSIYRC